MGKKNMKKEYFGHCENGPIYIERGPSFEEILQELDTCFFCLEVVEKNKWREHMDKVHKVVNHPMYDQVKSNQIHSKGEPQ